MHLLRFIVKNSPNFIFYFTNGDDFDKGIISNGTAFHGNGTFTTTFFKNPATIFPFGHGNVYRNVFSVAMFFMGCVHEVK